LTFIHYDPEFPDLLKIVAEERGIVAPLIEKDYWVTHTLWALQDAGLEIWFKGGTSLSKGFGLIQRFSEDLDLKVEGGARSLPSVRNWKSKERGPRAERRAFFEALAGLPLVDLDLRLDLASMGERCTNAGIEARYPGHHLAQMPGGLRPFVLLEVGDARVRPFVERPISSWVQEQLDAQGMASGFTLNRPTVRCIHPLVTLLEKLDAISRRFQAGTDPAQFVRHYEDAAHIIRSETDLPPPEATPTTLAQDMFNARQIRKIPSAMNHAFTPSPDSAWESIRRSHEAIAPMFWGGRLTLAEASENIKAWINERL
jgi:hypothetical protein